MKSRPLGIIFVAAVIIPSILLAVLSVRAAGREEAYVEKQLATTLLAEVIQTAGLVNAEITRMVDELRSGIDVPASANYGRILPKWKQGSALVAVPFLLSPRFGILWPRAGDPLGPEEKRFLQENGDFLSDRTATTVLENIAVRYQDEILAQAGKAESASARKFATRAEPPAADRLAATAVRSGPVASAAAAADTSVRSGAERQMAIDAFAQSPAIQTRVYEEAREKGDTVSPRVAQPVSKMAQNAAPADIKDMETESASPAAPAPSAPAVVGAGPAYQGNATTAAGTAPAPSAPAVPAPARQGNATTVGGAALARGDAADAAAPPAPAAKPGADAAAGAPPPAAPPGAREAQQSQFVVTSRLLSQIASRGDYGLIPRFIGDRLVFLFWEKQKDGRIAGCQVSATALRARIAGVLQGTYTPVRIITILDENGAPLATPPIAASMNWRQPFVAREIGESLPRWEAASYLTSPDVISSRARLSSLVVWILVLILFVSMAGGGTMVLTSMYTEIRLAQKKATFVANVSHELKTPLTSISLFVELLRRRRPPSPEKREQYLALMAAETERLTRLINNVLDFSAGSARKARKGGSRYATQAVDAARIAQEIAESQRVRLEGLGFSLTVTKADGDTTVMADPEALKQVILNLLSNAEKYSPDRKEIEVEVMREPAANTAPTAAAAGMPRPAAAVLIRVRDRGIGVAQKDRQRIFREFFRVDDSLSSRVQGTGLGLTIAQRIAREHGGEIVCQPRPGGGSDFIVRLPSARRQDGGRRS